MPYASSVHTLPQFDQHGILPAGDYELDFKTLRESFLVTGDGKSPTWDAPWRQLLVTISK
jgi:hypothetical protein